MKTIFRIFIFLLSARLLNGQTTNLSDYDNLVLAHNPVGYWMLTRGDQADATSNNLAGAYHGSCRGQAWLPNNETASVFNGIDNYFEIPDNNNLEVTNTGILTIEAWMRVGTLNFAKNENNYVHWMGKGTSGNQLWVARMYNANDTSRPQRISGYCFSLSGGLGAGSYFQDSINVTTWVHYALVINTVNTSPTYPTGYTRIYRDGVLRDTDSLQEYSVVAGNGNAPTRIATRDLNSFFQGAIGKVAIYNYELTAAQLLSHNNLMRQSVSPLSTNTTGSDQC